jgi:hypothetical protein
MSDLHNPILKKTIKETTLAGCVLASSALVCAWKHAGWVKNVISMSRNEPLLYIDTYEQQR